MNASRNNGINRSALFYSYGFGYMQLKKKLQTKEIVSSMPNSDIGFSSFSFRGVHALKLITATIAFIHFDHKRISAKEHTHTYTHTRLTENWHGE